MSWTLIIAGLSTGLLGSIHCAAMCGPLALAGCTRGGRVDRRDTLLYFLGRSGAYTFAGALLGLAGQRVVGLLPSVAVQRAALIAVAVFAAVRGIMLIARSVERTPAPAAGLVQLDRGRSRRGAVLSWVATLLPRRGLGLGLATGLLPCGLLAAAWGLAASSASPLAGAAVMGAFAAASLPGLCLPLVARGLFARVPEVWQGAAWCLLAVWISLRPWMSSAPGGHCH